MANAAAKALTSAEIEWLEGAIDMHVHSAPSIFPRKQDDLELSEDAEWAGMRAIVLKAHEGSTVERASLATSVRSALSVFGGVVLNRFVGGFNAEAVEVCLKLGGRIVWMPTIHATNDVRFHAAHSRNPGMSPSIRREGGSLSALDNMGRLRREVIDVLEVIQGSESAVLNTGHLGTDEVLAVVEEAGRRRIQAVVSHPELPVTALDLEFQMELARMGAFIERTYAAHLAGWGGASFERTAEEINAVGEARSIISSDLGQKPNPSPAVGLAEFCAALHANGLSRRQLRRMSVENPALLLGVG